MILSSKDISLISAIERYEFVIYSWKIAINYQRLTFGGGRTRWEICDQTQQTSTLARTFHGHWGYY